MAVESTAFSTSAEEAITRTIDVSAPPPSQTLSAEQFEAYYEIQRTVREIVDNNYHRVCVFRNNLEPKSLMEQNTDGAPVSG